MSDYLVWSNEHRCWWGPERRGYRAEIEHAGRYTREEAIKICRGARGGREFNSNPTEVPMLLADAIDFWGDDRDEWSVKRRESEQRDQEYREREIAALAAT